MKIYSRQRRSANGLAVLSVLLLLTLLVPLSDAQFKVSDNFNRADGSVGLDWSTWGNGAQINGSQLETFGLVNVAGHFTKTGRDFPSEILV